MKSFQPNTKIDTKYVINDGLNEMAANAVEIAVDSSKGIVYAVYLSSETNIGEISQSVKLAKFNILQPTNVEWVTVFNSEADFFGHRLSECNIIELNSYFVRVYAVDLESWVYYYKDIEKKSLSVGCMNEVKIKFDESAEPAGLTLENINEFLKAKGKTPVNTFDMTTPIIKADNCYYSVICGENIETPLFIKSADGEVWTFQSIINHRANFEAMLAYHDSKFWVMCRNGSEKETEETYQNLMYSEDGITWKQSNLALTMSDTRPYLFNYQGDLYLAYSSPMPDSYSTVRPWRCNIHIGKIVSVNGKEIFDEIIYKESKFGIVYYALLDWYGYMIMLYSSGELHPTDGLMFGWAQGKDCLNFTVLHSQDPRLSFEK